MKLENIRHLPSGPGTYCPPWGPIGRRGWRWASALVLGSLVVERCILDRSFTVQELLDGAGDTPCPCIQCR